jgi:multidrug efflux pump subunit AcrA (membrane-fusion protein)
LLAILGAVAVLVFLLWPASKSPKQVLAETGKGVEAVKLVGPCLVRVTPGTPLEEKLALVLATSQSVSAPLVKVTGAIVARLPAGNDPANNPTEGRWDFNSPDLAGAYADWLKARADVPFNEKELATIRELTLARVIAQAKVVKRLENLVQAGTDPLKDLDAAKADLLQAKLQGQKDEHEALTALENAKRTRATLERQLFQAGIDPELLIKASVRTAIAVAEVPEARIGLVQPGEACTASFYAFPDKKFSARVGSLAPTLSKELRTLRVFFELSDPEERLKPGMFAEIGLGTDTREALLVPLDGVIHVGRAEYMLVAAQAGIWRVTEVKVGEMYGRRVEILHGLTAGDRVIGAGAILLKPFMVDALEERRF